MIINIHCTDCGKFFEIEVRSEDYSNWIDEAPLDKCFPYLSPNERHLLETGRCLTCEERLKD